MPTEAQSNALRKYRKKVKRITVDFTPAEADIWEFVQKHTNKQRFIKDLIRVELDYESHWYDGLFNFDAFNPAMVRTCENYDEFVRIYEEFLIDGQWLLVNEDGIWSDFRGEVYVPANEIRPDMDKKELHKTVGEKRFDFMPFQFETLEGANWCIKKRFLPMNEAKLKAGFTDEIMHFTPRVVSSDIVCFDPPKLWSSQRWKSRSMDVYDELAAAGIFALRVTPETRKQIHDCLTGKRDKDTFFAFFSGIEEY